MVPYYHIYGSEDWDLPAGFLQGGGVWLFRTIAISGIVASLKEAGAYFRVMETGDLPISGAVGKEKSAMSISISSGLSLSGVSYASSDVAPTQTAAANPQPAPRSTGDVVQLAEAQRVYQLYNQGQRISQIASSLRLSVEAVNSYLGNSAGKG